MLGETMKMVINELIQSFDPQLDESDTLNEPEMIYKRIQSDDSTMNLTTNDQNKKKRQRQDSQTPPQCVKKDSKQRKADTNGKAASQYCSESVNESDDRDNE